MGLRLGDIAPDFKAQTTAGEINFHEYLGNAWGILFSHPADYTPVCTTELGKTALLNEEFAKRNVKVLAVSVDPLDKHVGWVKDINETQNCNVNFPVIADGKYGKLEFPVLLPIIGGRNLFITARCGVTGLARDALQAIILRLLGALPAGKLRLISIDPVGLGSTTAGFIKG